MQQNARANPKGVHKYAPAGVYQEIFDKNAAKILICD
jgi:hypothetical protein